MKEIILNNITTVEDVENAYRTMGAVKRADLIHDKYVPVKLPEIFKVVKLDVKDITIGKDIRKDIPHFVTENGEWIPVRTFLQTYTDKTDVTPIKKATINNGKFLVVNNRFVNEYAAEKSEAELVLYVKDKTFKTEPAKNYPVYQPEYIDGKPVYSNDKNETLKRVMPKSYQEIRVHSN